MKHAYLLVAFILVLLPSANAAFRFRKVQPAKQQVQTAGYQVTYKAGLMPHFREAGYGPKFRQFRPSPYSNGSDGPALSIASFTAAMLAVAGIALGIAGPPAFLVVAGVLAVGAIVMGAIALKRKAQMKSLAIAGLVIGSAAILAGIVYGIYVAVAIISFLGSF
jgi:hypothetical protein